MDSGSWSGSRPTLSTAHDCNVDQWIPLMRVTRKGIAITSTHLTCTLSVSYHNCIASTKCREIMSTWIKRTSRRTTVSTGIVRIVVMVAVIAAHIMKRTESYSAVIIIHRRQQQQQQPQSNPNNRMALIQMQEAPIVSFTTQNAFTVSKRSAVLNYNNNNYHSSQRSRPTTTMMMTTTQLAAVSTNNQIVSPFDNSTSQNNNNNNNNNDEMDSTTPNNSNNMEILDLTWDNVELVLDGMRHFLIQDGGNVIIDDIDGPIVKLQLQGNCGTCPSSTQTMKMGYVVDILMSVLRVVCVSIFV
jgi:Fe-S cluster biogenesis protein NfuA/predicted nucleic acid-binding Zn ribbon protein